MPSVYESDLVIVGAGPGGLSAAIVAAEHGLTVDILDEFPKPGGRMLGQFHEEPEAGWWVGRDVAHTLIERVEALGVSIHCSCSVHGLTREEDSSWCVKTTGASFRTPRVLLATGAAELAAPVPGWTLPGVMSIGAAQVMSNVHFVKPGNRGIIVGVNVLAMAIARELTVGGVSLAAIVLPPAHPVNGEAAETVSRLEVLSNLSHLAPSPLLRFGGQLLKTSNMARLASRFIPKSGVKVWDVPLLLRSAAISINGNDHVESVTLADLDSNGTPIPNSTREEAVDFVAIAGGLYPLAELAAVAGCPFEFIPELGGHVPVHSERMSTTLPGLYVAGNITGVESAKVAMAQGHLAGTTICADAGLFRGDGSQHVQDAISNVHHVRQNAIIQFHPGIADARNKLYTLWNK